LLADLAEDAGISRRTGHAQYFIGGATPVYQLRRLLIRLFKKGVRERVNLLPDAEITFRGQPRHVESSVFAGPMCKRVLIAYRWCAELSGRINYSVWAYS